VVSFEAPHAPCQVPEEYEDMYRDREIAYRPNYRGDYTRAGEAEHSLRNYYAMIKNLDDNVGRILTGLEASGHLDDTIVVYLSDHGDMKGSHGLNDKCRPEEESIRIPLLFRYPRAFQAGTVHDGLISLVDLMPTLLGVLGIPAPATVQGIDRSGDLAGAGAGIPPSDRDPLEDAVYIEQNGIGYIQNHPRVHWRCLRTGPWSLTVSRPGGPRMLFNLGEDPYEQRNLFEDEAFAQVRVTLLELMRAKAESIGDGFFRHETALQETGQ
jgi:arylsulfatase A-like enzyme